MREVVTNSQNSTVIKPQILIITCESCRDVHYLDAVSEEDVAEKFNHFQCKQNCERVYYSYITVGQITLGQDAQYSNETISIGNRIASAGQ